MNSFLIFQPKSPILSPDDLLEEAIEMLEPDELYTLLKRVIPDLGEAAPREYGGYVEHRFGAAPLEIFFRKGCLNIATYNQDFPDVRDLLGRLRALGLVVFDAEIGQLVTD